MYIAASTQKHILDMLHRLTDLILCYYSYTFNCHLTTALHHELLKVSFDFEGYCFFFAKRGLLNTCGILCISIQNEILAKCCYYTSKSVYTVTSK